MYEQQNAINKDWHLERYFITEKYANKLSGFRVEGGDIIVSCAGTIGETYELPMDAEPGIINQALMKIKVKESIVNKKMFNILFTNMIDDFTRVHSNGSAIKNIPPFSDLKPMEVFVPEIDEQNKISFYFSNLDRLITLHQRKLYIFMKKAISVWEQRKLGEIYGSIGNAFVGTATPYYVEQGHFYLESNNVKDGQINHNSEIFINDEFYEKQKDKWLHTGDMVMVQSGHVGHAAVIPEELDNTAAHALIMFRIPKEKIEPYFLNYEYQTNKAKKKIENITTGNTIKHILASDMQEFVVDVPKYEEQKVIADYFANLDRLITLHHRKFYLFIEKDIFAWEQRKFGSLLEETRNRTTVEDEDTLLSCAIDGMYLNSELFSHFRGSSNIGYLKIKKNDLILSAQNLHLGNCNVNLRFEHGIISPAYKVYELVGCNPLFMQAWVKKDSTKDQCH